MFPRYYFLGLITYDDLSNTLGLKIANFLASVMWHSPPRSLTTQSSREKKNSSRVSTYYDPTTVAELQIIYISWKNIFPAQSPFWSDKTKMWSDSIKGALVVIHENCAWCRRRGIPRLTDYYQPLTTKKVFLLVRPFICPKIIVLFTCEMIVFDIHSVRISCPTTVRTSSGMGQF